MTDRDTFQTYLDFRMQKAGALTPGQKLDLIRDLLDEARQGSVPTGERSVTRLPVDHPAVQAALRGEEVSLGEAMIRKKADWKDVSAWPLHRKLMLLGLIVLAIIGLGMGIMRGGKAKAEAEPTPLPTPTPDWFATLTAVAAENAAQPPPPTPPPPATATPAFLLGLGGPAEDSRDPASIEIAGRLFILARGQVDKESGQWKPQGPEWLAGTEVRRVFAVPYEALADAEIKPGDALYVRTRGGQVLTYRVRDVIRLMANQIEAFVSLRPSIVVALPMGAGDVNSVDRVMLFGEAEEAGRALVEESSAAAMPAPNAVTLGGVNLRDNPGLSKSRVIIGLPPGTPLVVMPVGAVTLDDHVWVYVLSPYGYGWVAKEMILMR